MTSRKRIERNLNPVGRMNNISFGLCQLIDGLVRVLSLGFLHTNLPLIHARETASKHFAQLKRSIK